MRNQGLALIGVLIIAAGVIFLIGNLFEINIGAFCLPVLLIVLGLFVLLRPRAAGPGVRSNVILIGDVDRSGAWALTDEEFWSFIADLNFDLTKAEIPPGETTIRAWGFIGDVDIFAREDIGLAVDANSFVTSFKLNGEKEDHFLAPLNWRSDGYKAADRRVRFELTQFIGDLEVRTF